MLALACQFWFKDRDERGGTGGGVTHNLLVPFGRIKVSGLLGIPGFQRGNLSPYPSQGLSFGREALFLGLNLGDQLLAFGLGRVDKSRRFVGGCFSLGHLALTVLNDSLNLRLIVLFVIDCLQGRSRAGLETLQLFLGILDASLCLFELLPGVVVPNEGEKCPLLLEYLYDSLPLLELLHVGLEGLLSGLQCAEVFTTRPRETLGFDLALVALLELRLPFEHIDRGGRVERLLQELNRGEACELGHLVLREKLAEIVDLNAQRLHQVLNILE